MFVEVKEIFQVLNNYAGVRLVLARFFVSEKSKLELEPFKKVLDGNYSSIIESIASIQNCKRKKATL